MAQFARPDSDIAVGLWTATPLWSKIDEATADDADLITSSNNSTSDICELGTSNVTDPAVSTGHIVRYRYKKSAAGGHTVNLRTRLLQGATQIASWTHNNISETFADATQTLSGAEADSITDYTNLRLEFQRSGDTGGAGGTRRSAIVSWAELEVPNAAVVVTGQAMLAGQGAADSAAFAKAFGLARIEGFGGTDAAARQNALAQALLTGQGRMDATALGLAFGAAGLAGAGVIDAAAARAVNAQAELIAGGWIDGAARATTFAHAELVAAGRLDAIGAPAVVASTGRITLADQAANGLTVGAVAAFHVVAADLAANGLAIADLAAASLAIADTAATGLAIGDQPA
ncbi:MAG: hypothetical protein ACREER_05530 [Alphaproteobacteria bacterium]